MLFAGGAVLGCWGALVDEATPLGGKLIEVAGLAFGVELIDDVAFGLGELVSAGGDDELGLIAYDGESACEFCGLVRDEHARAADAGQSCVSGQSAGK